MSAGPNTSFDQFFHRRLIGDRLMKRDGRNKKEKENIQRMPINKFGLNFIIRDGSLSSLFGGPV